MATHTFGEHAVEIEHAADYENARSVCWAINLIIEELFGFFGYIYWEKSLLCP